MAEGRIVGYVPPEGSNERTKLLRLKVIAGHNLAKKDIFGASDPYTRIDLVTVEGDEVEDSVLTKTKKRTLNPKWEEEFIFRVAPEKHKLVFEVFDENRLTRDDFLGMVELPLSNIPKEADARHVPHKYYILRPRSARSKVIIIFTKSKEFVKLHFSTFSQFKIDFWPFLKLQKMEFGPKNFS